tara:strand:+ start:166 stop:492 length:327 start_codon:yes stop_codon:yes gene_type:complete
MAFQNHNVTGEITRELLASGDGVNLSSISICNVHATLACTVDLYVEKKLTPGKTYDVSYGKFYILKNTLLPIGAPLFHEFSFDNSKFGLYIKLTKSVSETPAVDVIIS